jgi:anionic cell wall polymer biosynthesis LytR-Cps2A-Psr (LCP) family protein
LNDVESSGQPKAGNRNKKLIKVLLGVCCLLIAGAGLSIYIIFDRVTGDNVDSLFPGPDKTQAPAVSAAGPAGSSAPTPPPQRIMYNGKTYEKNNDIVSLLFLGIDYTEARKELNLGYRSDVVLVCAVDTRAKTAALISLPRDTYTTVFDIDTKTREVKKKRQNRINAAFAFGGGPEGYGFENEMACVEMFLKRECKLNTALGFTLDIPVYLYAGIDIDGIAPVAESVGGVTVTLEYGIPDVGNQGETVLLKGAKAEAYLRDRHNTPGGDMGRAVKEQDFLIKLAKKLKDMGAADIILNLWDDLQKYVRTNLTTTQMVDLAKILRNVDIDGIARYTIPGKGRLKNGDYFYFPDEEGTLELLLNVYYRQVAG